MKKFILIFTSVLLWSCAARAYVDHFQLYTLRAVIEQSSEIAVLRVEKVSRSKGVIVLSRVADLKGRFAAGSIHHHIAGGFRPREPQLILNWAEPGRIVVAFSNGKRCQICAGTFWYEVGENDGATGWWSLTHLQSILCYAYYGSAERLRASVAQMLAGKEIIIPVVRYSGDSNSQRLASFKNVFRGKDATPVRIRASMKMSRSPLDGVQIVGIGSAGPEDVPALVLALNNANPQARVSAAEELGRAGPAAKAALGDLRQHLHDPDASVRLAAAGALLQNDSDDAAALPAIIAGLRDSGTDVRLHAIQTVAQVGPKAAPAGGALAQLLNAQEPEIRMASADALGEIGAAPAAVIESLVQCLKDQNPVLRSLGADALGQAARENPGAATAALERLVKDPDARVRQSAARSLLELGVRRRELASIVADASKDDPWVYAQTLAFLVRSGGPEAGRFVCEGVRHPNAEVRMAAANLLNQLSTEALEPGVDFLTEGLADSNYLVSARCARSLWRLGPRASGASKALLEVLKNPEKDFWEPRACAAVALASMRVNTKEVVPGLIEALAQPAYRDLRIAAAGFLRDMGADAKSATEALQKAAQDQDQEVARAAREALRGINAAQGTAHGE